jgi:hypothetical protein
MLFFKVFNIFFSQKSFLSNRNDEDNSGVNEAKAEDDEIKCVVLSADTESVDVVAKL